MSRFTIEEKISAVKRYLEGGMSCCRIAETMGIAESTFRSWCIKYESMGMEAFRKTTLQERIDIVIDHIESGRSYAETAEKYQISYQQIYQWVQKYNEKGVEGLVDRRGRTKPEE